MYQIHVNLQLYKLVENLQEATSVVAQAMIANPGQTVTIIPVQSLDDQIIYETPLPALEINNRELTAQQLMILGGFKPAGQEYER